MNLIRIIFKGDVDEIVVGSLVACKSTKNGWYRGEVKGLKTDTGKTLIDIYFVDFGDCNYVEFNNIRKLQAQFFDLPMNAIECTLDDVEILSYEETWNEEAIDYFEEISYSGQWKSLSLKFVSYKEEKYKDKTYKIASVNLFDKVC